MAQTLDDLMRAASEALGRMDYLGCEALCLDALVQARAAGDWAYYARILLPLQEARRQRRMIASEGVLRLGTAGMDTPPDTWLAQVQTGCVTLTHPHTRDDAATLHRLARQARAHVEVLFADNPSDAATWRIRSYVGPDVVCDFAAPPQPWRETWMPHNDAPPIGAEGVIVSTSPADWFLNACEALGDAALAGAAEPTVEALEPMLEVAPDHEILHQRLAQAARERSRGH